jgi:hypothetical protein
LARGAFPKSKEILKQINSVKLSLEIRVNKMKILCAQKNEGKSKTTTGRPTGASRAHGVGFRDACSKKRYKMNKIERAE